MPSGASSLLPHTERKVIVEISRLNSLERQLWLVLLFQLSTQLLVMLEVGPQHQLQSLPNSSSHLERSGQ